MGRLFRKSSRRERQSSPVCSGEGTVPPVWQNAAGQRGAREAVCGAGCLAAPRAQEIGLLRVQ